MDKIKNSITLKFTVGLSLITILILTIQNQIFKLYDLEKVQLVNILLILSITIIPVIGLYVVAKICCKKSSNSGDTHLLTKIFIISIILTMLTAIYYGVKFGMFGNIEEGMPVISKGAIELFSKEILESYEETSIRTLIIIANVKSILKALMLSTIYIGALILVLLRHWTSKEIEIDKEETIRQIKQLLIATAVIIAIEVLVNVGLNIKENNIPMSITIRLENKITKSEKQTIENKLKEMDEIINYKYIDDSEASNEFKEWFEETFGDVDSMRYEDYKDILSNRNIERFDLTVHNKNVDSIKKALEGMRGIEEVQGMSIEF